MFRIHFQFYQVLWSNQIHTNKFQLDVFKAMNHNGCVIKDSFESFEDMFIWINIIHIYYHDIKATPEQRAFTYTLMVT